jgi:hypothetical protein
MKALFFYFLLSFTGCHYLAIGEENYPLLAPRKNDDTTWSYPLKDRIVAIGDIHGDFDALISLLLKNHIIDDDGKWIAGKTQLVQMGDLVDRWSQSRIVMDFLMNLEQEAKQAGGDVFCLLGNHEIMISMGLYDTTTLDEMLHFFPELPAETPREVVLASYRKLMTSDNRYTRWMRSRKTVIKIGDTLFMHAGFDENFIRMRPEDINATVLRHLEVFHGVADKKEMEKKGTGWILQSNEKASLLWNRQLAREEMSEETLDLTLAHFKAKGVVIGHNYSSNSKKIETLYGGKVMNTDSGLSFRYQGSLDALEITKDGEKVIKTALRPFIDVHYKRLIKKFPFFCFGEELSHLL